MSAPKGNQFWKMRAKDGRDKLFATPTLMWEAACEYFQYCVDNPLMSTEYVGKNAKKVLIPKVRAFTMHGLCIYLDCNTAYFRQFKISNTNQEFSTVVTRIEEIIYNQKFENAAAGFLKENLIARDLGLADKRDENISYPQLSDEQFQTLLRVAEGNLLPTPELDIPITPHTVV